MKENCTCQAFSNIHCIISQWTEKYKKQWTEIQVDIKTLTVHLLLYNLIKQLVFAKPRSAQSHIVEYCITITYDPFTFSEHTLSNLVS